jgi:hypothetical protein
MFGVSLSDAQWGNVPAGAGALLTGISLLIAANVYGRSVREAKRNQADRVAAWLEGLDTAKGTVELKIRNASSLPIYKVIVETPDLHRLRNYSRAVIPPGHTDTRADSYMNIALVQLLKSEEMYPDTQPSILFRDAAGRCWKRAADGNLRRVSKSSHEEGWRSALAQGLVKYVPESE